MQAQAPNLPYVGLWARLERFQHGELSQLMRTKRAVRTSLMRNTIHLVTTRDAIQLKPLFQPLHERGFFRGSPWGRDLKTMDFDALLAAGSEIMGERPRTIAELAKLLAERFPDRDPLALAYGVRYLLPMVFVTPRGIWQAGGPVALTTVEAWLGRSTGPPIPPDDLVLRYLAAFGPASPADMRAWSGLALPRLRAAAATSDGLSRRARERALRPATRPKTGARYDRAGPLPARLRQHPSRPRGPDSHHGCRAAPRPFQQQRDHERLSPRRRVREGRLEAHPDQVRDSARHHPFR